MFFRKKSTTWPTGRQTATGKLAGHFPDETPKTPSIKPLLNCLIVISSLMLIVFAKMEVRRLGYVVFKLTQVERKMMDEYRKKQIFLAQLNRPERIEHLAQTRLNLKKAKKGQIIQLIAGKAALKY